MYLPVGIAQQQRRHGGASPPVLETTATYNSGGSLVTTAVIPKPSGVVSGDLLVAFMTGTNGVTSWAQLSGWTMIDEHSVSGKGKAAQYKIAGGSEPTSYTFSLDSGSSGRVCGAMLRISGAHGSTPINAHSLAHFDTPSTPDDCTNIMTTVGACLGIVGVLEGLNATTKPDVTFPTSGWTQQLDFSGGSFAALAVGKNTDLGAAGSKACQIAWTTSSMDNLGLFLIGIAPP